MTTTIGEPGRRHAVEKKEKKVSNFRPDLEGMRAVAVLAVFADHLLGWPTGGFVGVDIFFVLSGFFITGLLLRERTESGTISFPNFYIRRVRRIIPAALLVLTVTVLAAYITFPATRAKETLVDALWAAAFAANWRFEQVGTDYFQEGLPPSPIQHYWSLSVEEQFYFVWPVVLLGLFWITRRSHRRKRSSIRQGALGAAMFTMVATSFIWAMLQSSNEPTSAYFSTFTRVWELGVGALLAIAGPVLMKLPDPIRPVLAYIGLAGVIASLFVITSETQFPAPGAALPVLSTALVVAAFHGSQVRGVPMLTNRVALYFGRTSYSLYLWHWPVIVVLAAVMPEDTVYFVVAAIAALVLAHVSFTYFEDPIRRSKWLERPTSVRVRTSEVELSPSFWRTTGFITAAVVVASAMLIQLSDRTNRAGEQYESLYVAGVEESIENADPCFGAAAMVNKAQCDPSVNLDSLTPRLDTFAKDTQGAYSCWRQKDGPMPTCRIGSTKDDALRVALIGDSHAAMLLPALSQFVVTENWSLRAFVGYDCQWEIRPTDNCGSVMASIQEELLAGDPYDLILTTASRKYGDVEAFHAAWTPVIERGSKVVAIADNPSISEDVISCMTRFGADSDDIAQCGTPISSATEKADNLVTAANAIADAAVVDMTDLYCSDGWCPAVIGNVVVARDTGGHITATYSRSLAPYLLERIRPHLPAA
ncbi:acyltransferase family protein [Rhodococcus sp. R1101]|uniref:acyltransferase family protein n=1 Tax=Rhodococcus sp. R1101 TaxID=1170698 RepID=UPI000373EC9C|nr:acyltransferase family protein [Rhodococcus sp. R1101]